MNPVVAGASPALELALDPTDLPRFLRAPSLAALRQGRARTSRFSLVWHDSADGALARLGQALEVTPTRRGATQRLLQVLPRDETTWLPGTPASVLAETALPGITPSFEDASMVGLAAAEGTLRQYNLLLDGAPLRLEVRDFRLRAVAAEQASARLTLIAEPRADPGLPWRAAMRLTADTALLPAWPLAEAARALARGEAARPPRLGAPSLAAEMTVQQGFAHAAAHLFAVLAWLAPLAAAGAPDAVHQARVAIRRLRSGFALWRPAVGNDLAAAEDAALRGLANLLGPVRDRDVFLAGTMAEAEALLPGDERLALVREAVGQARGEARQALAAALDQAAFRHMLLGLGGFVAAQGWRAGATPDRLALLDAPLAGFAARELGRRRRRMLRGHDDGLEGVPIATLHALRLSGKRLRYAAEFFAPVFARKSGKATRRYLKRLAALQEALGQVNNSDVAQALLAGLPAGTTRTAQRMAWAAGAVAGITLAHAARARATAEAAWQDFRDAPPFWA